MILERRKILKILSYSLLFFCLPIKTIYADERKNLIHKTKSAWLQTLAGLDHEEDDPGTVWNKEARERDKDRMSPRQAWRAIQDALPKLSLIHI